MAFNLKDLIAKLRIKLDKGEVSKVDSEVKSSFDKMEDAAKRVGKAIIAAFAIKKVFEFTKDLVRSAAEASIPWNRLENTLANVGIRFTEVERTLRLAGRAFQDTSTHDAEDFAKTLDRLVSMTGNFNESLKNTPRVADVAAKFFNGDLAPATDLVAQAMNGLTRGLRAVGIVTDDAAAGLQEVFRISEGARLNELETLHGKLGQVGKAWGDIKEEAGFALVRMVSGSDDAVEGLEKIRTKLMAIADFFRNEEQLTARAELFMQRSILSALGGVPGTGAAQKYFEMLIKDNEKFLAQSQSGELLDLLFAGVGGPGKKPPARPETPEQEAARKAREKASAEAEQRRRVRESGQSVLAGDTGLTLAGVGAEMGAESTERMNAALNEMVEIVEDEATPALDAWEDNWANVQAIATGAAFAISDAFQEMFSLILTGSESVGNALVGLGKNSAAALISGLADYFRVEQAKEIAAAIGKFASGTWPPNPLAIKAGFMHLASATAWGAAGGLAGGVAGAIGGGGGGGGGRISGGASDATSRGFEGQRAGPTTIIMIDGFDPDNPVHVRHLGQGIKKVAASDSSVEIRPRGR